MTTKRYKENRAEARGKTVGNTETIIVAVMKDRILRLNREQAAWSRLASWKKNHLEGGL